MMNILQYFKRHIIVTVGNTDRREKRRLCLDYWKPLHGVARPLCSLYFLQKLSLETGLWHKKLTFSIWPKNLPKLATLSAYSTHFFKT